MLKKLQSIILFFFLSFSFIDPISVIADPPQCEMIQVDRRRTICKVDYDARDLERRERSLKRKGHSALKARGILGELYARDAMESETSYVSLFTLFREMGCQVQEKLRDGADRGIDDIFVRLRRDGHIHHGYNPLFLEAKYSSQCALTLGKTSTLCQQLSVNWLVHHVGRTHRRVIDGAQICLDNKNTYTVRPCAECYDEFKTEIGWIAQMLADQRFHRAASLLCPDGKLRVYDVVADE